MLLHVFNGKLNKKIAQYKSTLTELSQTVKTHKQKEHSQDFVKAYLSNILVEYYHPFFNRVLLITSELLVINFTL